MRLYGCGYNVSADRPGIWLIDTEEGTAEGCSCDGVVNPSYATVERTQDWRNLMYAACEVPGKGRLAAFEIGDEGVPRLIDTRDFYGAAGTCFVLVHPSGKCVYGADYDSGSICSCKLEPDGRFGEEWMLLQHFGHGPKRKEGDPNLERQAQAHVHTLSFVPGTGLLAAVDLGMDTIFIYEPRPSGEVTASDVVGEVHVPAGCGPRIVAYHPLLPYAAVVCELSCEVLLYSIGDGGRKWELLGRYGLIDGHGADWEDGAHAGSAPFAADPPLAAHAEFTADGRWLYVSTRGTNTISAFESGTDGALTPGPVVACGGHCPRHFAISPDQGMVAVANQESDCIALFERDPDTGTLSLKETLPCQAPSCVIWDAWQA